ncbi:unnamed protein product [Rotaria socialis]|uniref:Uncharacterized protein n=1 Tax=Rotaria socialis TaxID=392032 RepID=A0A817NER7_9BILA|nr:unnamed protein product [Rotaria socialis]CAF4479792.1 unnamed protein product [Rotaria socialis]
MIDCNSYFIITILCLQTLYNCIVSIIGQYIYGFFLRTYDDIPLNWTIITDDVSVTIKMFKLNQEQCVENTTDLSNSSAQAWAQQQSADLVFRATLWRAFPVIVITYLFGLYASRLNRRLVLIFSILGNSIHVLIYQAIIYKNLAEYWWYVAAFIAGLAGGTNILGIVINLVITESTEESERSSRFVCINAVTTALASIATFGIGYYIQWRGYTDLLWAAIALEILSIFVVILFLKPTNYPQSNDENTALLLPSSSSLSSSSSSSSSSNNAHVIVKTYVLSRFYHCFGICEVFNFRHHSKNKSISIILIIVSYIFYLLALSSMSTLVWYLLGTPFCWTSKNLGQYSAVSLITTAIFSALGMKLLTYIGANDAIICSLSHICFFVYAFWISLAQYSWQLYLALLINPFSGYQGILTTPMIVKWLEVHERSDVFTLLTEINTIILAFGSSLFNWIYAQTVVHQKNFTLLFASGLCIIPIILNLCLFVINRRISNAQEINIVSEINTEPAALPLTNNILPQVVDIAYLIQLPRSRTDSFYTSHNDRSLTDSYGSTNHQTDTQIVV